MNCLLIISACCLLISILNHISNRNFCKKYEYYIGNDHLKVIESRLNIELSDDLKLVKKQENFNGEWFYYCFLIDPKDLNKTDKALSQKLKKRNEDTDIPNFENTCKWFKISEDKVICYYKSYWVIHIENGFTSHDIFAFVCEENGRYYLYLSF